MNADPDPHFIQHYPPETPPNPGGIPIAHPKFHAPLYKAIKAHFKPRSRSQTVHTGKRAWKRKITYY